MKRFDLYKYFSSVVCLEDAPLPKPDAAPTLKALKDLGVSKAILIGDTPDDISSATFARIIGVGALVVPGADKPTTRAAIQAAGAVTILTDINQIVTLLKL